MTASRIDLRTEDGVAPAFEFGTPGAPQVLVLMDGLGMRPAMHELAERVAAGGYRVLMPDLFYRLGAYTPPDAKAFLADPAARAAWWGRVQGTPAASLVRDIGVFLAHLGDQKVGVTGYCMGGRLALLAAETYPERVAAAAAFHPGGLVTDAPDSPHLAVGKIKGAVYVAGAVEDANFTDAQRQKLDEALTAAGVDHQVELYQAKHGWVPTDTPVHDAAAAARHWDALFAFFARTLR